MTFSSQDARLLPIGDVYADWKGWDPSAFGTFTSEHASYFEAELEPYLPEATGAVLEIGFGSGALLGWLRARGIECIGVESTEGLVALARKSGFETGLSIAEITDRRPGKSVRLVVAFDVLEHIPEHLLGSFLATIREVLHPQGVFVARFPNGDSPFGRAYQYSDPTHVNVLGVGKIDWYARSSGMRILAVKSPAAAIRHVGWARALTRIARAAMQRAVDKLISFVYFAGGRTLFSASIVVVMQPEVTEGVKG
jgi:SAM-dependent methyltransferase